MILCVKKCILMWCNNLNDSVASFSLEVEWFDLSFYPNGDKTSFLSCSIFLTYLLYLHIDAVSGKTGHSEGLGEGFDLFFQL